MTEQPQSWPMIRAMGGVGLLCALLIVATYQITLPIIERNRAAYLERAIFKVLPGTVQRVSFRLDDNGRLYATDTDQPDGQKVYAGYDAQKQLVGVAIEARGQGFQDVISVLYGYAPQKQAIIGFEVLESKETPGLGDKIGKDPAFLQNFEALNVSLTADGSAIQNPIVMVKHGTKTNPWEIDAITGATISSKAVATILQKSTAIWVPIINQNLATLSAIPGGSEP